MKNSYIWRSPHAQPIVVRRYSDLIPDFETPVPTSSCVEWLKYIPKIAGTNYAVREKQNGCVQNSRSPRFDACIGFLSAEEASNIAMHGEN